MYSAFSTSLRSLKQPEQIINIAQTHNAFVPRSSFVKITAGTQTFNGMCSGGVEQEVTFYNAGGTTVTFNDSSSSAPIGYRFDLIGVVPFNLGTRESVSFRWSKQSRTWCILFYKKITAYSPLLIAGPDLTIQPANVGQSGYLSSSDWNTFNGKINGTGASNEIPYWTNSSSIGASGQMFYAPSTKRIGFQENNPESTVHAKSSFGTTISDPTSFTQGFSSYTLPTQASATILVANPDLQTVYSLTLAESGTSSGTIYNLGDAVTYRIFSANSTGALQSAGFTEQTVIITVGGTDLTSSWSTNGSCNLSQDEVIIFRDINTGGFNDYIKVANIGSFYDSNLTPWNIGASTPYTPANDFWNSTNSASYSYDIQDRTQTPASTDIWSVQYNYTFAESGNVTLNDCYRLLHSITTAYGDLYILKDSATYSIQTSTFTEYAGLFSGSGSAQTPTTWGILSNGTNLNLTFDAYSKNVINSTDIYGANPISVTQTDPNDGNYYYFNMSGSTSEQNIKVIVNAYGYLLTPSVYYIYYGQTGDTTTTITPTTLVPPAIIADGPTATGAGSQPQMFVRTADTNGVSAIEFRNDDDSIYGSVKGQPTGLDVNNIRYANFKVSSITSMPQGGIGYDTLTNAWARKAANLTFYDVVNCQIQTSASNTNTNASEITQVTYSIPASYAATAKTYRWEMYGTIAKTGSPTITYKVKIGSTTLATLTGTVAVGSETTWLLKGMFTVYSYGSSAQIMLQCVYQEFGTNGLILASNNSTYDSSVNLTQSNDFKITSQWGTSSASNILKTQLFNLEQIK